jgi:ribonuclease P protein component
MTKKSFSGRPGRISKAREYAEVYKKGLFLRGRLLHVYILKNGDGRPRLGVSISRLVNSKASVRNKLKRIIKEWFRLRKDTMRKGYDIVAVIKKPIGSKNGIPKIVRQELSSLLRESFLYPSEQE